MVNSVYITRAYIRSHLSIVTFWLYSVSGRNGTASILSITLTKFNKFLWFITQFILTFKVTEKCTITTCTTQSNDDVSWHLQNACANVEFLERETPEFISPLLWPPNSPDLNPVDYSVWSILQEKVYKTRIIDLDDVKRRIRIRTECAKLIILQLMYDDRLFHNVK